MTLPRHGTPKACAICGFGEHMAIHRPVLSGARAGEPYGHYFEPTPQRDKPEASASTFARAAWLLDDYARLLGVTCGDLGDDLIREAQSLDRKLRALDGEARRKEAAGPASTAAEIIAAMLADWRIAGSVWYLPSRTRWRLTGANYQPCEGEVCVGVYAPGASAAVLREDFEAVQERPLVALIGNPSELRDLNT